MTIDSAQFRTQRSHPAFTICCLLPLPESRAEEWQAGPKSAEGLAAYTARQSGCAVGVLASQVHHINLQASGIACACSFDCMQVMQQSTKILPACCLAGYPSVSDPRQLCGHLCSLLAGCSALCRDLQASPASPGSSLPALQPSGPRQQCLSPAAAPPRLEDVTVTRACLTSSI